ncbi:DUF4037 domain-containing protein [Heyndrickxia oleronia]|uniref:DUF4037 domain-containing protein n=1 Tax=Heyndrickxia oleronia TaxID=38875 RepID=UPI001B0D6D5A|nr:DUF4037 domain-containing protein [Heyndrickxia oleronia]GIN37091.1 hypothetical protein J19TS1_00400 [Heyndrickxia oleronia]
MNLKLLASDLSKIYSKNKKVEAVLLGGSVSRNWDDEYSDIELFIFWKEAPLDEDRLSPIKVTNGSIIEFYPYEEEEWSETYITRGVKLEISNFLTSTVKRIINDVIKNFDIELAKQCLVATVQNGHVLFGINVINELKKKVTHYPNELSKAMIKHYLDMGNRWNNREALLAREDWLMLHQVIVSVHSNVMGVLFGLNRHYVHHPAFKWQRYSLEAMKITPKDSAKRLSSILLEPPKKSVQILEEIIQELYEIVQREYPQMDLSRFINQSAFLRPKNSNI